MSFLQHSTILYCTSIKNAIGPHVVVAMEMYSPPPNKITPPAAAEVWPSITNAYIFHATSLFISLGQLSDDECIAIFTKCHADIIESNKIIIRGVQKPDGIWSLPLCPTNVPDIHLNIPHHLRHHSVQCICTIPMVSLEKIEPNQNWLHTMCRVISIGDDQHSCGISARITCVCGQAYPRHSYATIYKRSLQCSKVT